MAAVQVFHAMDSFAVSLHFPRHSRRLLSGLREGGRAGRIRSPHTVPEERATGIFFFYLISAFVPLCFLSWKELAVAVPPQEERGFPARGQGARSQQPVLGCGAPGSPSGPPRPHGFP